MTTQTKKMITILTVLDNTLIGVSAIENTTGNFFVIYYKGSGIQLSNAIYRTLESIEGLSVCKGEAGYTVAKGNYITVNY